MTDLNATMNDLERAVDDEVEGKNATEDDAVDAERAGIAGQEASLEHRHLHHRLPLSLARLSAVQRQRHLAVT